MSDVNIGIEANFLKFELNKMLCKSKLKTSLTLNRLNSD